MWVSDHKRKIHHFPRSDSMTVYQNMVLFLCKGHCSKNTKFSLKETKKKGLRKETKRATDPNVQG